MVHVHYAVSHPPSFPPAGSLGAGLIQGFQAALGGQTPISKTDRLISPALFPKEVAGNCEQAFKICRQGHSGEEDIFALPIRSPTAADITSGRYPARALSGSAQTMAAAPPATEESSVSYEELNDLNAEFDDAETELSMDFPFLNFCDVLWKGCRHRQPRDSWLLQHKITNDVHTALRHSHFHLMQQVTDSRHSPARGGGQEASV